MRCDKNPRAQGTIGNFWQKFHQKSLGQGAIDTKRFVRYLGTPGSPAQGTIEYLVILAVVVVIGLIVVSLSTGFFDSASGVATTSRDIDRITASGIVVTEGVVDAEGNILLNLRNQTGQNLTLTSVDAGGSSSSYEGMVTTNQEILLKTISENCKCSPGQTRTTCEIQLTYDTRIPNRKETITIELECLEEITPVRPPIEPKIFYKSNGTIYCPNAEIGETGIVDGVTYTAVNNSMLAAKNPNEDDYTKICTSHVTNMTASLGNSSFNQNISFWDTSSVTNMTALFASSSFNQDIGGWDVSKVQNMEHMFENSPFNQDIGGWDTVNVTNMKQMFQNAASFNQDISDWDVSKVTNMTHMFTSATSFYQDISGWDVGEVVNCYAFSLTSPLENSPELKPNFTCSEI